MDSEFVKRLRDPELWGIPFKTRVARVRQRMANERVWRRGRILTGLTYALSLIALCASLSTLTMGAQDAYRTSEREQRREISLLRDVMYDVEDRVWRDNNARGHLLDRVREYQRGAGPRRQGQSPQHMLFRQPNLPRDSWAFFEAFPSNGTGTFGPCATTPPQGVKGEQLTFTRASSATCTKTATGGLATTLIADGDLVTLSSNVARVEYDSNGTLGLLVEAARTNSALRSQEWTNAVWTLDGALTRTDNTTTSPDGTVDAATLNDTSAIGYQGLYQDITAAVGTYTCSLYAKGGTSTAPLFQISDIGGTGTLVTISPTLATTSWSRITRTITTVGASTGFRVLYYPAGGPGTTGTGTTFNFGAQCELGAYATSYIPTTSAAVTRATETSVINGSALPASTYCIAASITPEWATAAMPAGAGIIEGQAGSTSGVGFFFVAGGLRQQNCHTGCSNYTPAVTVTQNVASRWTTTSTGGTSTLFKDAISIGSGANAAAVAPWDAVNTGIGYSPDSPGVLDGIVSRLQVDPDITRCTR